MAQAGFEAVSASRRLQAAGFDAEQAEAVVKTVSEVNLTIQQVADDLTELKSYIHENMATRKDLERFATKEDLREFATREDLKEFVKTGDFKAEIAELKADLFRFGFIAAGILVTLILGLASMIAAMSVAAL